MNNNELCEYIVRYATTDITKTAILLSGKWGSGKSYFISHDLCKKLKEKKVKHVVVSLYGVGSLKELSKQLYCSLRLPVLSRKSETKAVISITAHNIINNALSFNGVSLDITEKKLQKIYDSVNLQNVLIIFEDIERSSIDALKLLGFINGLVEYDGAKVLLVANEKELINKTSNERVNIETNPNNNLNINNSNYKRIKEKTIGDTIIFEPSISDSIKSIIQKHPSSWSKTLLEPEEIDRLVSIVKDRCDLNLRLFLYALQKCSEIFAIKQTFEDDFYRATFEGMLIISKSFASSDVTEWRGGSVTNISSELGDSAFPVFRFAYNYLKWHTVNEADIVECSNEFKDYRFFEKNAIQKPDDVFKIITTYYVQKETDVIKALNNLEKKLEKEDYGGVFVFEILGYYVIKAGIVVGYNTDLIIERMIHNAGTMRRRKGYSSTNAIEGIGMLSNESLEVTEKYNGFIHDLSSVVELEELYHFSYKPQDINKLSKVDRSSFYLHYKLLGYLDAEKLTKMLMNSSAAQIKEFSDIIRNYYADSISSYNTSGVDYDMIQSLIEHLNPKVISCSKWDKIQKMQIANLITLLDDISNKIME